MKQKSLFIIFRNLFPVILLFSLLSCEKDALEFNEPGMETTTGTELNKFRRKVVNPYTIPNMQKALDSLMGRMQKGKLKSATNGKAQIPISGQIMPNILYIKFTPQTPEEEGSLQQDSTLALIDYPLGYEYDEAFFENRPPLKEGEIPAYYTTVPVDYELPTGVPYEVLEEMHLPQEDESLENNGKSQLYRTATGTTADFVAVLLHQAFKQTDNIGLDGLGILKKDKTQAQTKGGIFGDKWLPRGTLRIWDDNIGTTTTTEKIFVRWEYYNCDTPYPPAPPTATTTTTPLTKSTPPITNIIPEECVMPIYRYEQVTVQGSYVPLVGAQVLLRATFTIGNEITNSDGYFQFDHKRGQKRYIIQWERHQYSIRNGSLFQAETRGPKQDTRWDHDIKGGDDEYHGMIHMAAYDYYYGSRFGLTSPPRNEDGKQIKIAAREQNDESSYVNARNIYFGADISLQAYGDPSDEVYGTAIHELAHAAHRVLDQGSYDNLGMDGWISPCVSPSDDCNDPGPTGRNNRRLLETWASTVEIMFALRRYRDSYNQPNYEYEKINNTVLNNFRKI